MRANNVRSDTTKSGKPALIDAYQESLDLAVYLRQKIEEDRSV